MRDLTKETKAFVKDLKEVFDKHDVTLEIWPEYGSDEVYMGDLIEIFNKNRDKYGNYQVYIEIKELEDLLK